MLHTLEGNTKLRYSIAADRQYRNLRYMQSLKDDHLLFPFRFEAGLIGISEKFTDVHWGWDSPFSQIRGTFTGHWLSAMAKIYFSQEKPDLRLKARADFIVSEIAHCQKENGGKWAFPIPEKYLHWIKTGKRVWAPHYVCHKVMMGLLDMHLYARNDQALEVVKHCADWFYDFTNGMTREALDDMLEIEETGGIMEFWADLYAITKDPNHLELMRRYERHRLFEPIFNGIDVLSNLHANTTVPEVHGAARAYEVTGEERYRTITENYWKLAVDDRGTFVTGGQTSGEVWTPPGKQASRLNDRNQEHCVVYNMMRLSRYLYRWTGHTKYADYYERNLYNGIFAQGYWEKPWDMMANEDSPAPQGLITYYLPLWAGGQKLWGSKTEHFWCCHCSLVQANAFFHESIFFRDGGDIHVAQYIPANLATQVNGKEITITMEPDPQAGENIRIHEIDRKILSRPSSDRHKLTVNGGGESFTLKLRIPQWVADETTVEINGQAASYETVGGHALLSRTWGENDLVIITFPKKLTAHPLPDLPNHVAFTWGPVAYAGLTDKERTLYGDIQNPESFMIPDNERLWSMWLPGWRTVKQPTNIRFVPIYEIGYEKYTVYFPVEIQKTV